MTIEEAARELGLAPGTLRIQARRGKLRAEKRGREWWVTPRELERYRATSLGRKLGQAPKS